MEMNNDIVARLRAWIPCYRADTDVAIDIAAAANEIERLRKELDTRIAMCDMRSERIIELEGIIDSSLDDIPSLQASIDSMSDEITMLVKERDEARREACYLTAELDMINHTSVSAESIALEYEWDCFKEEADHNNEYFRTHHK